MADRGMRRGDKEIVDQAELHRILDEAMVMRLGMLDGDAPLRGAAQLRARRR